MAEETDPVESGQEPAEPATDWKAEARKWEKRSKENAEKAKAYDELKAQSDTDLKRAQEQAAAYKKEVDELNAKSELDAIRAKVAKEAGVPAELVSGDDEDSMRAFAKALAAWGKPPVAPRTSKPGTFSGDAGDGKDAAKRELARKLFGSD
jgi:membrane protein involved in colicin uptake